MEKRLVERRKAKKLLALACGVGLFAVGASGSGIFDGLSETMDWIANLPFWATYAIFLWGLSSYMHSKGYSYSYGFLGCLGGLVSLGPLGCLGWGVGPLIALILRERPEKVDEGQG